MSDPGRLSYDEDGYLDLASFPAGDPDSVLDEETAGRLHDAIEDDQRFDDDVALDFIEGALDGTLEALDGQLLPDDTVTDQPADERAAAGSAGPFDLSGYDDDDGGANTDDDVLDAPWHAAEGGSAGEADLGTYDDDVADSADDSSMVEIDAGASVDGTTGEIDSAFAEHDAEPESGFGEDGGL